jgi:SNF2 family DNA or RNA helicase
MKIKTKNGKSFSLKFDLFDHQKETFKFIQLHKKCFVFNEAGTGKTEVIVSNICYNILEENIKKVLIVSTLSTLDIVWLSSFKFHNLENIANPVVVWDKKKEVKEKILNEDKHTTYIINPKGVTNYIDLLLKIKFDYVIIDEATIYKEVSSNQFKAMSSLLKKHNPKFFILATGTPVPNRPLNALGLLRLMYPKEYSNKAKFQDLVEIEVKKFMFVPKPDAMETLNKMLQPSICFKKKDVIKNLKESIFEFVECKMSEEQLKHFKTMHSEFIAEVEKGNTIESVNAAVKSDKLLQIIGGSLKTEDKTYFFDVSDKINKLKNILKNKVDNKAIIFCSHIAQLEILKNNLTEYKTEIISGSVSQDKRTIIYNKFQNTNEIDLLIAMPECMSHGLTLTSADSIIYYNVVESNEIYTQANARISRPGQEKQPKIFHLYCNSFDYAKYMKVQKRMSEQDYLLCLLSEI